MMVRIAGLAMAITAMCGASAAHACSSSSAVSISFSASPVSIADWNPLSATDAPNVSFNITLTRASGNPNTDYALLNLTDPDAAIPIRVGSNSGFAGPQYSIKSSGVDIAFAKNGSVSNTLRFDFANGSGQSQVQKTATFAVIANSQSADFASGNYSENLGFTVACFKSNGSLQGTYSQLSGLGLNVTAPNRLTVITAGPQTINFGSFSTTTQNLAISLKSTGSINALISTANGNKMVLTGAQTPYPTNSVISYNMTFDSQSIPAAGANLSNLARAGVNGANKALVLTLPSLPTGKLAGTYQDVITITLSAGS